MFAKSQSPQTLTAEALDDYLLRGWFRMGQTIFTTNFLNFKNEFYSAIWLRIDLARFSPDNTQKKIGKKNACFRTEVLPARANATQELLYEKYKKNISFEPSASLNTLLYGKSPYKIFDSFEVNVYDGDKLIATGFFDVGKNAAAGISSFYDPDYKKYSLGRYLIYLKIEHCRKLGLRYFYPGYFVPGYKFFDYKLTIGQSALEYLDLRSSRWLPIDNFSDDHVPLTAMWNKLTALHLPLLQAQIESRVLKYEYFDANLVPGLTEAELLDFPLVLWCQALESDGIISLVIYEPESDQYKLLHCISVWSSGGGNSPEGFYSAHLLKAIGELTASRTAEDMAEILIAEIRSKTLS
jgi:leucyl-tRNA---protein transferase